MIETEVVCSRCNLVFLPRTETQKVCSLQCFAGEPYSPHKIAKQLRTARLQRDTQNIVYG